MKTDNTREVYCPCCEGITHQGVGFYDPDNPDAGLIWICSKCGESIDIVENTFK